MGVTIKLDGYDELLAELNKIEDQLTRSEFLGDVVQVGGEVLAARAKQECPRGDDEDKQIPMWASITVVVRKYLGRAAAFIGPDWRYARHGHLVEYGHEIVPRGEGKTADNKTERSRGGFSSGKRSLGRAKPDAFMRRSIDATQGQQLAAMSNVAAQKVRELGGT